VKELGRQVYLGGYEHEEHAAEAYDVAALKCKGFRVKTNFDADRYAQHRFTARLTMHHCTLTCVFRCGDIINITISLITRFLVGPQDLPRYAPTRPIVFMQY